MAAEPVHSTMSLPALVSAAASRLASATSSAEVLDARDMANASYHAAKTAGRMLKAKGAHDELLTAAYRAQADALEIECLAKIRLADEYDAAQERGEVAQQGAHIPSGKVSTADLGLTSKEVYEARQLRDAALIEPGIIHDILSSALDSGDSPTKARLRREIKSLTKKIRTEEQTIKRAARDANLISLSNSNAPLPDDRSYPVIYADPPWEYDFSPSSGRAVENHYPTMPIEEIWALPVEALATEDAILFLWAPPSFIKKGIATLEAWGFELASSMTWDKEKIGTGIYFRQQHEYLLLGKRGKPITPAPGTQPRSVYREARKEHSAKPEYFYGMIERMYPGLPKIELFSRSSREGWAAWGNQA